MAAATVSTSSTKMALLASHEHQDAQELLQLLSECVREEAARWEGGLGKGDWNRCCGGGGVYHLHLIDCVSGGRVCVTPKSRITATFGTRRLRRSTGLLRRGVHACGAGIPPAIRHFSFGSLRSTWAVVGNGVG